MGNCIRGYIVGSIFEHDRVENMRKIQSLLPHIKINEAIYPTRNKVPFMRQLLDLSHQRTGYRLNEGELGCLLSHRRVWYNIVQTKAEQDELFLVCESDSSILNIELMKQQYNTIAKQFDIFFWGAWEGHMKLYRSTKKKLSVSWTIGTPFLKTVYCTYGYSLNKKGAAYLLKQTVKISHPVDQFKYFIKEGDIRIGGIVPELISTIGKKTSYIRPKRNFLKEFFILIVLDIRNTIICFFK